MDANKMKHITYINSKHSIYKCIYFLHVHIPKKGITEGKLGMITYKHASSHKEMVLSCEQRDVIQRLLYIYM